MPHPRIDAFDQLQQPADSAAAMGYHMPAEWEPHACIWLSEPHNPETWPLCLDKAQAQFAHWMTQMCRFVPICTTAELGITTNDSWMRDFGPIFVIRGRRQDSSDPLSPRERAGVRESPTTGEPRTKEIASRSASPHPSPLPGGEGAGAPQPLSLALHDFHFNGWGGKYEHRDADDTVPQHIAKALHLPLWVHDMVLEGGAIDVNGQGAVMTTEQCLLNKNRNPNLGRAAIEAALHDALGTRHVIWLPGGIEGDDTDGHIDDVARFVNPNTVLAVSAPPEHVDHAVTQRNLTALRAATDQDGQPLNIVELPAPQPIAYDFPADRFGPGGRQLVPASYANFLITNGSVFVPTFNQPTDEKALRLIEAALPGRTAVPIPSQWLVVGLGAMHCLSQQQPTGISH